MRRLSQDFLNRVELYFEQLLPRGLSKKARSAAKDVLQPLYDEGTSAKQAARFLCSVDASDPTSCVAPLSDFPKPSRGKAARQPAARVELPERGEVALARPRSRGATSESRPQRSPDRSTPRSHKTERAADAAGPIDESPRAVAPSRSPATRRPISAALGYERGPTGPDHSRRVLWEPDRETNGFLLALGGSGSGKSELLKALALRTQPSVPVVILDFHGDLTGLPLADYRAGRGGVSINPLALVSRDASFGGPEPQTEAVIDAVRRAAPGFGRLQEVGLREALKSAYATARITDDPATWQRAAPGLSEVREHLRRSIVDPSRRAEHRSLAGVLAAIDVAFSDAAFRGEASLPLATLVSDGGRIDLSHLNRAAQILAADALLRQIFGRLRSEGVAPAVGRYRVLVIADEASLLKGAAILDEIFKEARKFGLALVLASQEAADFSASVRANAATLVALRTNSAREAAEYSKELSRVSPAAILQLTGPGDGYLRNHAGTRRIQVAPTTAVIEAGVPAPGLAAVTVPSPTSVGNSDDGLECPEPVAPKLTARPVPARPPTPTPAAQPVARAAASPNLAVQQEERPAERQTTGAPGLAEVVAKRQAAGRIWIAGKTKKPPGKGQIERWEPIVSRKLAEPSISSNPEQRAFWEGVRDFLQEAKGARAGGSARAEAGARQEAHVPAKAQAADRARRAAKLQELAAGLDKQIAALRDSGTHHQRPTARRARIASSQDQQADRLESVRAALLGLARALRGDCVPASLQGADQGESNCLPASLAGIDTRLIVEELLRSPTFPVPGIRLTWLKDLVSATANVRALSAQNKTARQVMARCGEYWCGLEALSDIAAIEQLAQALRKASKTRQVAEEALRSILPFKRALAAGIHSQQEWTQARADLIGLATPAAKPDPLDRRIRDQERSLIGQKIPGYFPTPRALADRVVALAQLAAGLRVLEPEAGKGDIAAAIRAAGIEPDVIEINATLRALLELKGFRVVASDFLEFNEPYDRILMNPPFEDNQDIRHVRHAFSLLTAGGRLVAIMGEGAFFRRGHVETEFREWLEFHRGQSEKLPPGSFLNADRSTGVATRLVVIDKGEGLAGPGPSVSEPTAAPRPANPAPAVKPSAAPAARTALPPGRSSCPQSNPACGLGLLGGACGLPAALVLAAPAGAPVPQLARYCLASARKLIASHDPRTFAPRPDYPAAVQERRYDADQGEQLKVLRVAEHLNPSIIFNTSPSVTDGGTPVVTERGIVLGGNGRTLGLQRHYLDGGQVAKSYLREHAEQFGFSPADIDALEDPVVVRVVDPGTAGLSETAAKRRLQQLVRVLNVTLIKELDQQASAVALARQLDEGVFNTLAAALDDDKTLAEYLHSARSRDLVVELQRVGVLRETNLSTYVSSAGFTESGRRLLEKTLAASLVEDANVLEALGEGTQATLARAAPWLVAATAYGVDWDVRPLFLAAARDVVAMRRAQIRSAAEYLRQNALFPTEASPSTKLAGGRVVLQVLAELAATPLRFARFARSYYDDARQNLSAQAALFAAETITPAAALARAAKAAGVDLLDGAPPSEPRQPSNSALATRSGA